MERIRRRIFVFLAGSAAAVAQQPVIITAGESIFGPPQPTPAALKNAQCPNCLKQNEDTITEHYAGAVVRNGAPGAPVEFLVGCTQCRSAFWQRMKGQ